MRLKNRVFFLVLALSVAVGLLVPAQPARAYTSVSVSFFYDSLAPYGDWVTVGSYGRCWRPARVAVGWQPYVDGEWIYTDAGWTWQSYDPWGGDPYHYGTWVFTARYGWVWIPGTIWAPAWVTWCITDDAFGWAPVPPSFVVGISGYSGRAVTVSRSAYVFVLARQFVGVNVSSVRVPATQNATFIARSRPMTRFAVQGGVLSSGGPALPQVERVSGKRIERVNIAQAKTEPVPIRTSLQRGSGPIVVPANERAKLLSAHEKHAPQTVSRGKPEVVTSERAAHSPPPPPAKLEKHEKATAHQPPPPSNGRHEKAVVSQPQTVKVEKQPQSAHVEKQTQTAHVEKQTQNAPPVHVEKQPNVQPKPQGPPPPAHGNPPGKEKEKEHGKEN